MSESVITGHSPHTNTNRVTFLKRGVSLHCPGRFVDISGEDVCGLILVCVMIFGQWMNSSIIHDTICSLIYEKCHPKSYHSDT